MNKNITYTINSKRTNENICTHLDDFCVNTQVDDEYFKKLDTQTPEVVEAIQNEVNNSEEQTALKDSILTKSGKVVELIPLLTNSM